MLRRAQIFKSGIGTNQIENSAVTTGKLNNDAVTNAKLDRTAVRTIRLAAGEKLIVEHVTGFPLLEVDNDTKKVNTSMNVGRIER